MRTITPHTHTLDSEQCDDPSYAHINMIFIIFIDCTSFCLGSPLWSIFLIATHLTVSISCPPPSLTFPFLYFPLFNTSHLISLLPGNYCSSSPQRIVVYSNGITRTQHGMTTTPVSLPSKVIPLPLPPVSVCSRLCPCLFHKDATWLSITAN